MELQDKFLEGKKLGEGNTQINKLDLGKDSIQYNSQDLDQEQKVDVNPVQLNTQNLHIFVNNDKNNYSGKITGITYMEENKEIVKNLEILLFFGCDYWLPVYKTNSDQNGNFVIEDIPPGYYSLYAELGKNLKYRSHYIKVLPGQNVNQLIFLK
jgi:hypothetical protein